LCMIIMFAAPCVWSFEMYRVWHDACMSMDQFLFCFEPDHRRHQWWWGNMKDKDALVDMLALDSGPRIFASCLATWGDYGEAEIPQCSEVFKYDEQGIPTWYVFVLELRERRDLYIDLVVHADSTMMEILLFVRELFRVPVIQSTVLILWGLNDEGEVDVDDPYARLDLSIDCTCAVMHQRFAEVFAIMQQAAAMMENNLHLAETDHFEHHYEWRHIIRAQAKLLN